jgi:hypothetical protein
MHNMEISMRTTLDLAGKPLEKGDAGFSHENANGEDYGGTGGTRSEKSALRTPRIQREN